MKSKILRASGTLQIGQTDILASSLESELNRFLLGDVVVCHISQSSAILHTASGLLAHVSVCVLYENKQPSVPPVSRDVAGDPLRQGLWKLLKRDCGGRAVVDRRTLRRRYPNDFKRVQDLVRTITKHGNGEKLFSLAMDLNTSESVLKAYLE